MVATAKYEAVDSEGQRFFVPLLKTSAAPSAAEPVETQFARAPEATGAPSQSRPAATQRTTR